MTIPMPNVISWPLGGVDADGRLDWSRDDKSIREVMLNILLTRPGERLMQPDFGAGLLDFVHQPNNETTRNLLLRMKEDEWNDVINTNLTSLFRLSKACLRGMLKARSGRIINIASVVALTGNPGQANYAAAKAGMIGFTKALAREVAPRGITVNCVAPGFIQTDMTTALTDEQRAALIEQIPAGRLGDPDDIAAAVAYLASPAASYITGETIHVNGGMFMA